jgi:hypothetical protein
LFIAILFVGSVAAVFLLAAGIVLRLLLGRKSRTPRADRIILTLAAVGIVCIAYAYFVEPNRLTTTHVDIQSSKIPAGKRPIRIVHFSDIHSESRPRLERQLVDAVAAEHPDLIVFTGDSINVLSGLRNLRQCIAAMAKIAPTFVVRGNWDTENWFKVELFGGTGAIELNGDAVRREISGVPIWIAGLAFDNRSGLNSAVRRIPEGEFSLFLYHSPDLIPDVAAHGIDLYCAGHTHGGQVALPFYGALVTLSKFGKRYESGLYHERSTWLYVNRGIGMAGGILPRLRFWSRPELTVIDVRPAT